MPQSLASVHVHLVFSTKNRVPDIRAEWRPRLHEYIGGILRAKGCTLVAAGGMPDHVHLLVSMGRTISIAEMVGVVKANSSGWIHGTIEGARLFGWQDGYAAFAVSFSDVDAVTAYIADQEEHHRKRDFKAELRALLEKHLIEYDERYLWIEEHTVGPLGLTALAGTVEGLTPLAIDWRAVGAVATATARIKFARYLEDFTSTSMRATHSSAALIASSP